MSPAWAVRRLWDTQQMNFFSRPLNFVRMAGLAGLITASAAAQSTLDLDTTDRKPGLALTSISLNLSRQPTYDYETGETVPGEYTVSSGSFYANRIGSADSVTIIAAIARGEVFPNAEVRFNFDPSRRDDTLRWKLTDARLNNYSTYIDGDNRLVESFEVTYATATIESSDGTKLTLRMAPDGYSVTVDD